LAAFPLKRIVEYRAQASKVETDIRQARSSMGGAVPSSERLELMEEKAMTETLTPEMEAMIALLMARIDATRAELDTALGQLVNAYLRDSISGVREGRYEGKALERAHRVSEDYEDLLKRASRTS
jgi:hypothetical protein